MAALFWGGDITSLVSAIVAVAKGLEHNAPEFITYLFGSLLLTIVELIIWGFSLKS